MKPASIHRIKAELKDLPKEAVIEICLRLGKFKLDNKSLLSYLLFEAQDETAYAEGVKADMRDLLQEILPGRNRYHLHKGLRKMLRELKKAIRISGQRETEIELLLFFCREMCDLLESRGPDKVIQSLLDRQLVMLQKRLPTLHEDLQFDYERQLEELF